MELLHWVCCGMGTWGLREQGSDVSGTVTEETFFASTKLLLGRWDRKIMEAAKGVPFR